MIVVSKLGCRSDRSGSADWIQGLIQARQVGEMSRFIP